ncbi:(Fe-S)-binding protein [Mumia zhuanghuii]|uniref:(Fe-S)-binding protein n=3 Tax=Mumia zhuanghuii TaxID=2585211 RepID=A0A5C4MQM4_9ACTN|nr:(Fe-S)-binding protein [Mumia zhuanghuii]TNC46368.1 (Fe-S)-binding protein [Mumia zhuanghuii]
MRLALFTTCLVDVMYPSVGRATVELLERLGHEVTFPEAQACCGQMHVNTGYQEMALPILRNHLEAFAEADAVVAPSGSCVAAVRHQQPVVARTYGDAALLARVEELGRRTYELSELLVDVLGVTDVGAYFPHRVTLHTTCHSLRMLRVGDRPQRLLHAVEGLELVDLPDSDECCGFGGTFAVKNADTSTAMLADKCRAITGTGADVVTAGDFSCLMHIEGGLSRQGETVRPVHYAEILASTRAAPYDANRLRTSTAELPR